MTPHPLADRIARLIEQWRERANETSPNGFRKHSERAIYAMRQCAAELEKIQAEALAQGVPPSPEVRCQQDIIDRFVWSAERMNAEQICSALEKALPGYTAELRRAKPSGVPPASAPDSEQ